jgi:hypothetical protein
MARTRVNQPLCFNTTTTNWFDHAQTLPNSQTRQNTYYSQTVTFPKQLSNTPNNIAPQNVINQASPSSKMPPPLRTLGHNPNKLYCNNVTHPTLDIQKPNSQPLQPRPII